MRNPVAWIRWIVALGAIVLAVLFYYQVFVRPGEGVAPAPTVQVSPSPSGSGR